MKHSDQRLFFVVFFFSCLSINSTSAMTTSEEVTQAAQAPAPQAQNPKFTPLEVMLPTKQKRFASWPKHEQTRSVVSPVGGMRYSASWPDFRKEYRSETPPVDRRNSESQSARYPDTTDHKEPQTFEDSVYEEDDKEPGALEDYVADDKQPQTFEDFVYDAKDAAEFVKILRRNPNRLEYFLEKLTLQMLDRILSVYSSDFLYCCVRDKIMLEEIDRAIRHDKFMKASEPCILKINFPVDRIEAENNFVECVGDTTVLHLLAQRGLRALIQISLLRKYIPHCNTENEQHLTALDCALRAHAQTKPLLDARGLLPEQRVRYRHEVTRLEECIKFLRDNGALTGFELTQKALQELALSGQKAA